MTRVRFNTDRALFDAFPSARDHVRTEPVGGPPLLFLKTLSERQTLDEAVSFCAYLLPRREAVAWGCRCLRLSGREAGQETALPALQAAEAWVEAPGEETRQAAYDQWTIADKEDPASWLALGAAWSGGPLLPGIATSMPAPPHLTATVVRAALLLRLHRLNLAKNRGGAGAWIAAGAELAETGL